MRHQPTAAAIEHFWAKVDAAGDCWEWTAGRKGAGYGSFAWRLNGEVVGASAHRFAYETLVGPVPPGLQLDHLCRNRLCVNPDHLEPVTHAENHRRGISRALDEHQTRCKNGHEFTPENTRLDKRGVRNCRACACVNSARYRAKLAA